MPRNRASVFPERYGNNTFLRVPTNQCMPRHPLEEGTDGHVITCLAKAVPGSKTVYTVGDSKVLSKCTLLQVLYSGDSKYMRLCLKWRQFLE